MLDWHTPTLSGAPPRYILLQSRRYGKRYDDASRHDTVLYYIWTILRYQTYLTAIPSYILRSTRCLISDHQGYNWCSSPWCAEGPRRTTGRESVGDMCANLLKNARLIQSSCKEHREKHRSCCTKKTSWISARRSTLIIFEVLKSINSPLISAIFVAACSNSPSLSHLLYNSCYTTAINILRTTLPSQPRMKYLARSFQCLLLAPCKGIVENNGRFSKDAKPLCQVNALFPVRLLCSTTNTVASRAQGVPSKACCGQESWSGFGPRTRARTR